MLSKRKARSTSFDHEQQLTPSVQQMQAKRRQTSDGRAMTLPEQEMSVQDRRDYDATPKYRETRTTLRQTNQIYNQSCTPTRQDLGSFPSESGGSRGLANGVSWTVTEYRLTDGHPTQKPLCMIPFGVLMSDVKAGKFARAHEPVFVYLSDGRMLSGIRIRLLIEGTSWGEMKAQPLQNGKSITKGDLAMKIAMKLEEKLPTDRREKYEELYFVELVQECQATFRPNFKTISVDSN